MLSRRIALLTFTVGSLSFALAQDPTPAPAAPGLIPAGFRTFVATDERFEKGNPRNRADKMHDLITDYALNPVVAVFSRLPPMSSNDAQAVANPEVSKLAVKLNELTTVKELKAARFGTFVAFLTLGKEYPEDDKRDEAANQAKVLAVSKDIRGVPFAVAAGKSDQTAAWGIAEKDTLTVVFYREMKVLEKWTFTTDKPLGDDDVKTIAAAVLKELGAKK